MALHRPGSSKSEDLQSLFRHVEEHYPAHLREHGWYLTTAAALTACGLQRHLGSLYQYLASQPNYETPTQRQHLIRRLREALFKTIMICGIPKVMDGIASIARVEQIADQDHTTLRQEWQVNDDIRKQAEDTLEALFRDENKSIGDTFGSHRELSWISVNISYGCFLADHRILDIIETELTVLPAIMCQNLQGPSRWHVKACQNLGLERKTIKMIQSVTDHIATFSGLDLDKIERIDL